MTKNRKFAVHFDQINAGWIDVVAKNEEDAEVKASRIWRRDYGFPRMDAYDNRPGEEGGSE
jgi:hypothetical protein